MRNINLGDMHTLTNNPRMAPRKPEPFWPQDDPNSPTTFGERVAAMRRTRGYSQNRLSKVIGCSQPFLSDLEAGKVDDMGGALLFRLSDALECSARWLLWGTGPIHKWEILTDEERALIKRYRTIPPPLQDHVSRVLDSLMAASSVHASPANPRLPLVPRNK